MKKKMLQELIENAKQKDKFIYQRYNGIITKYIDNGDYYIDCETGIGIKKNEHLMLGKVSENIIDLIEIGDYVNEKLIHNIDKESNYCYLYYGNCKTFVDYQIKTILTKESYMANCYKVGE